VPGVLLDQLTAFLQSTLGPEAWDQIVHEVGVRQGAHGKQDEISVLVAVAAERTGTPAEALLARFGESIVPDLLRVFGVFVKRDWTAFDLLENTETVIHRAVRLHDASARPPHLRITRPTDTRVVIHYASPRRLCAMAKGILRGIATHYGEPFDVVETACMHTGATTCTLVVTAAS
jgi:hypothetical protein